MGLFIQVHYFFYILQNLCLAFAHNSEWKTLKISIKCLLVISVSTHEILFSILLTEVFSNHLPLQKKKPSKT